MPEADSIDVVEGHEVLLEPLPEEENAPSGPLVVFVVPCYRRHPIARACFRQLRRTCDELGAEYSLRASAVLVSNEQFFVDLADELGFSHVARMNHPLGRKWNDGIQFACEQLGADFVVPFGSDNAVDAALVSHLPSVDGIRASRCSSMVNETCTEMTQVEVTSYEGGVGIRTIPRELLVTLGFRPAEDDLSKAIDGSMARRIAESTGELRFDYVDLHPLQIVGFKSDADGVQLTPYALAADFHGVKTLDHPLEVLAETYPREFLVEIDEAYRKVTGRR